MDIKSVELVNSVIQSRERKNKNIFYSHVSVMAPKFYRLMFRHSGHHIEYQTFKQLELIKKKGKERKNDLWFTDNLSCHVIKKLKH